MALASSMIALAVLATPVAPDPAASKKDKMVCKERAPTGTRFNKRTCMSAKERAQNTEEDQRKAGELINQGQFDFRRGE